MWKLITWSRSNDDRGGLPDRRGGAVSMTVGSLFSGVGGFDLGLECAGMEITWQVEYDEQCQQVLRRHWPGVELYGDVREVRAEDSEHPVRGIRDEMERERGGVQRGQLFDGGEGGGREERSTTLASVDLICGGFPCQDLSVAGNRAGLDGDRSGLWHEFRRIIGEIAPRWVLIENVPGLLSSNDGRDMGVVLRGLEELGYGWAYRVLDSQFFGVPQRRRRVFIVGHLGDARPAFRALFPVGTGLPGDPPPSKEAGPRVARGAEGSTRGEGGGVNFEPRYYTRAQGGASLTNGPVPCLRSDAMGSSDAAPHVFQASDYAKGECVTPTGAVTHTLTGEGHDASEDGTGRGTPIVQSKKWPADVAPTMNCAGMFVPEQSIPRRLTPKECERLQGFPDDHTAWGVDEDGARVAMADSPRYRMMGNAVTVNVAHWIGRRIMEAADKQESAA